MSSRLDMKRGRLGGWRSGLGCSGRRMRKGGGNAELAMGEEWRRMSCKVVIPGRRDWCGHD